jgi:NADH:ubiquinone oxidoreductase subunit C
MENKMTNQELQRVLQSVIDKQYEKVIEDLYPDVLDQIRVWNELEVIYGFVAIKNNVRILTDAGKEKLNQLKDERT